VEIELLLDSAEIEAEAAPLGVPLDPGSVLARRVDGIPEVHITGAADLLLGHLAAQLDALGEGALSWRWPVPGPWRW
jgi:hypothetical protein